MACLRYSSKRLLLRLRWQSESSRCSLTGPAQEAHMSTGLLGPASPPSGLDPLGPATGPVPLARYRSRSVGPRSWSAALDSKIRRPIFGSAPKCLATSGTRRNVDSGTPAARSPERGAESRAIRRLVLSSPQPLPSRRLGDLG